MVGFSRLYCSILETTAGVATFGFDPPISPGGRRVPVGEGKREENISEPTFAYMHLGRELKSTVTKVIQDRLGGWLVILIARMGDLARFGCGLLSRVGPRVWGVFDDRD